MYDALLRLNCAAKLSGATVLAIDGADPFVAANETSLVVGGFQSFGTRQNAYVWSTLCSACCRSTKVYHMLYSPRYFSDYMLAATGWSYLFGNFAQMSRPLVDSVTLEIQRINSTTT